MLATFRVVGWCSSLSRAAARDVFVCHFLAGESGVRAVEFTDSAGFMGTFASHVSDCDAALLAR